MTKYEQYETIIGLETHVQLSTKSKAFCSDDTTFGGAPNAHVSAISLGHPGTLPKSNRQQIEFAIRLGIALGCTINPLNSFDRKNYFYTDLPKGYQITQDKQPICLGGSIDLRTSEGIKTIRIHHIHMEEDAGKSIHDQDPKNTLVDLNRAGVPLLEVVSEPDFRTAEEVDVFMNTMRQLVRYLEISDGNMQEGSMRCDCNISIRKKGETGFNNRCEVKNMNSMRFARKAIEFETKRQIDLVEAGGTVLQQTLNFDPATGRTSPLRTKENAHDYRYFPEPDLPPILINEEKIKSIRANMPPLPQTLFKQFTEAFQLSEYDATILTEEKGIALFFQNLAQKVKNIKSAANLMINKIVPYLNESKLEVANFPIKTEYLVELLELIDKQLISNSVAYQKLFPALIKEQGLKPKDLAEKLNLLQNADSNFIEEIVNEVIAKHPDKVKAYQKGKKGLIGFFMGEVMRASKGQVAPKSTQQLLREKLG